jgi:FG-GAP repeat/IPT/TIG domain
MYEQATLSGPDLDLAGGQGSHVAIDGDTALVAAEDSGSGVPLVYVFVHSAGAWSLQATIRPFVHTSPVTIDALALSGDTAVIGCGYTDEALVYVRSGTTWSEQQELQADPPSQWLDDFGAAVAISGDTIVVGAPGDGQGTLSDPGAVYVFQRTGTSWTQQADLSQANGVVGDDFGSAVAIDGDTLLVGAWGRSFATGTVYVYSRAAGTWSQTDQLWAADKIPQMEFGCSVALSGQTALVGAPYNGATNFTPIGGAYVFSHSTSGWIQQARLQGADSETNDGFGDTVALSGDLAIVDAPQHHEQYLHRGVAYAFRCDGSTWTQQAELLASNDTEDDGFGQSVAVSQTTVIVGAPLHTLAAAGAGQAYVFMVNPPPPPPPPAPKPSLTAISPLSGRRGSTVTITGADLGAKRSTSYVTFGACKCGIYSSWSAGRVKVRVPAKAAYGSIKVRIVTSAGTSNYRIFKVKR